MPELYRVFPHLSGAGDGDPGGALFVPSQGGGRIDNPSIYSVLYLGDTPQGAIAEAFGRFPEWQAEMLAGTPSLPGSQHAIARYRLPGDVPICNLDDPQQLLDLEIRPSDVVSRDYDRTRRWARRIHAMKAWGGVRWWSYYNPEWSSFALWENDGITLEEVTPLHLELPALIAAARAICRPVRRPKLTRKRPSPTG